MLHNNPLLAQLKAQLNQEIPRIEGVVKPHEKGYGFLETDNKKSYFIPQQQMRRLLPGDLVSGLVRTENDKTFFEPEKLVQASLGRFIAQTVGDGSKLQLQAEQSNIKNRIRIANLSEWQTQLQRGDWVVAQLVKHPLQDASEHFQAEIVEYLTNKVDPLANWICALARYQLQYQPVGAENVTMAPTEAEDRQDLTALPFFTIDSQQTEDMDDAIYIERTEENQLQLLVAIADPAAYIQSGDTVDQQAQQRLFSTYLPALTIPMLPQQLANDCCSLKAASRRPAIICRLLIDQDGAISDKAFSIAWIESKAKLDYQSLSDYLEHNAPWPNPATEAEIAPQLALLQQFVALRQAWRQANALQMHNQPDFRFIFDEQRQVINIVCEERRAAHNIIEEAMIAANQALASYFTELQQPAIFNIHRGFDPKHLELIIKLLSQHQIEGYSKDRLSSFDGYCALRRQLADKPKLLARVSRYQTPADVAFSPEPHCGLGFSSYLTWTSPIRKYSDLVNHRILKAILRQQTTPTLEESLLKAINDRRSRLRLAERDLSSKLYAQYLAKHLGEAFTAEVRDINKGGARLYLTEIGAQAFMPLSLIHNKRQEIESRIDSGSIQIKHTTVIQLGDIITVRINEIKPDSHTVIVQWQAEATSS